MTSLSRATVPLGRPPLRLALKNAVAFCIVGLTLCCLLVFHRHFRATFLSGGSDVFDFASIARSLLQGHGFSTDDLYPLTFGMKLTGYLPENFPAGVRSYPPVYYRQPLWPLLIALFFGLTRVNVDNLWLLTGLLHLTAVGLTCFIFRSTLPRMLLAGILVGCSPYLLYYGVSGLSESLAALVLLVAWMLSAGTWRSPLRPLLLGTVLGLAWLTKQYLILLLPIAMLDRLLQKHDRAFRDSTLMMAGFAVTAGPWLARNFWLTGDPFYDLRWYFEMADNLTSNIPLSVGRGLEPTHTWSFVLSHFDILLRQSFSNVRDFTVALLVLFGAAWPAAVCLYIRSLWRRTAVPSGTLVALGTPLLFSLMFAPFTNSIRYLVSFTPAVIAHCVVVFVPSWVKLRHHRAVMLVSFSLALAFASSALQLWGSGGQRMRAEPDLRPLQEISLPPESLIMADDGGWPVAWRLDRPVIWLPVNEGALAYLLDHYPVRAVYLGRGRASRDLSGYKSFESFRHIVESKLPVMHSLPAGILWLKP